MQSTLSINYPNSFDRKHCIGKLPPIRKALERKMCAGRVWIFLIIGVFLVILGLVSFSVYISIDGTTTSTEYTEIMPLYINSGAVVFAGLVLSSLFWKRFKVLVFFAVVMCVAAGFLCGTTAVLTLTHVITPLDHLSACRFYRSQTLCQCLSPYRRNLLVLEYSETDLSKLNFENVSSCEVIQEQLPQLLYALIGTYTIVFLTCVVSAILSLLVLRAERLKRGFFRDEVYEEVYTVSGHSSQDQSDCESEVNAEVILSSLGQQVQAKNRTPRASNSDTINSIRSNAPIRGSNSDTINSTRSQQPIRGSNSDTINSTRSNIPISRSGTSNSNSVSSLQNKFAPKQLKTPVPNELAKENLANRYRINKTPDREVTYRHRISKTPDREVGSSKRRNSFIHAKRLSKSCDSLESSGSSRDNLQRVGSEIVETQKTGRLKEHRRKGKRAATVATLDTDQLLLILNLQMRYLQETKEQKSVASVNSYPRRAITPQPTSTQKIPQKVRSHTPQPQRANNRKRSSGEQEFYAQIDSLQPHSREKSISKIPPWQQQINSSSPEAATVSRVNRRTDNLQNHDYDLNCCLPNSVAISGDRTKSREPSRAADRERLVGNISGEPYNPYLHTSSAQVNSVDSVHFLTYSDNMHRRQNVGLRTRDSVNNQILPPQPIHRGGKYQLPPQPISRRGNSTSPHGNLPPQPMHRGQSAFHVVDRGSKSRSPSVTSDASETMQKRSPMMKDFADMAIRENFRLNPSPFLLQNLDTVHVRTEADGRQNKDDQLPPYSSPPSYKEYVSSCDSSVNSSLSSNPDQLYSMPKHREGMEQKSTNQTPSNKVSSNQNLSSKNARNLTNQISSYSPSANQCDPSMYLTNQSESSRNVNEPYKKNQNLMNSEKAKRDRNFNVYGNDNLYRSNDNVKPQNGGYENPHNASITQSDDALYSFPIKKSRVKQCIVPEDYYSSVTRPNQAFNIYANEPAVRVSIETSKVSLAGYDGENKNSMVQGCGGEKNGVRGYNNENSQVGGYNDENIGVRGYKSENVSVRGYNGENGALRGHLLDNSGAKTYAKGRDLSKTTTGLRPDPNAFNQSLDHQIAPDAKYHEYEDVYDTPAELAGYQTQQNPEERSAGPQYSINNHGFSPVQGSHAGFNHLRPKGRTTPKSGAAPPHDVSDVSACSPRLLAGATLSAQVTNNVHNVHAKNVENIPRIKLNESDDISSDMTDDDVFVDPCRFHGPTPLTASTAGFHTARVIDFSGPVPQQTHMPEPPTFYVTNETQRPDHVTSDLTNQGTDSGYVKMTLPEKLRDVADDSGGVGELLEDEVLGGVIADSGPYRHIPVGGDEAGCGSRSLPDTEHYEETGV